MATEPLLPLIVLLFFAPYIAYVVFGIITYVNSIAVECPKCRKKFVNEADLRDHTREAHGAHLEEAPEIKKAA